MARDEAYREAEKKIEEARRLGATELDSSNMTAESPEMLGTLTQLRSLKLSDNGLTALPEVARHPHAVAVAQFGRQRTDRPAGVAWQSYKVAVAYIG